MELGNAFFGSSRGEFKVPRDWQSSFLSHLYMMGFDTYGNPRGINHHSTIKKSSNGESYKVFETEMFVVMPYYYGDDEEIASLPNFIYKPTEFKLSWYKYALRDSYMNKSITKKELEQILLRCLDFIEELGI